ncbi:TPA: hypothetical protein ACXIWS_003102 [Klebsiella pneumoniae]|uniref:hypothetical protein n=1 Tax=Klebsiella pneumoniae complex TaxID=3390273 RepID=UPI0020126173|nr:hypothetical protein [Klebsiella quasipneumoniae]MCL1507139.1 hypothetical protein [Klebsiella quasipneumoniae]USP86784.1 hypothetical protein MKM89_08510 [Klebsiella quasipneumoniae]
MTKSTITREQLIKKAQEQIEFCRHTKITGEGRAHVNQCAALFEIALAAMDSKPVVWGNGCDKTVPAALRYLAENERPFGGESRFNAAHLYQLAREIELMAEAPLYRHAQPAPEKYNIGDATMRHIFTPTGMTNVSDMQAVFDRVEAVLVGMEQPAPVVPDGYVMVPLRLTAENGAKGALSGEFSETKFVNCPECFGDDECETCDGSGRIEITVPVTWTTIKEIWAKGVEHFAAAPQEVK